MSNVIFELCNKVNISISLMFNYDFLLKQHNKVGVLVGGRSNNAKERLVKIERYYMFFFFKTVHINI